MNPRASNLPLIGIAVSLLALIGFIFGARVMLDADQEVSLFDHPEWPFIVLSGFVLWHFARKPNHLLSFCERIDSRRPHPSDRRLLFGILTSIILIGFSLRLADLDEFGLVCDEGIFVYTASLPTYAEVLRNSVWNSHPPANYFMLHTLLKVSWNATWLRMVSLLSGTYLIWITYLFGRRFLGVAAGLMMAILMAFSPNFILLSRVARNYTPGLALLITALYFFVRFIEEDHWPSFYLFAFFEFLSGTWHYAFLVVYFGINLTLAGVFIYRRVCWTAWLKAGLAQLPVALGCILAFMEHLPRMSSFIRANVLSFMIDEFYIEPESYLSPLIGLTSYLLLENNFPMAIAFFLLVLSGSAVLLIQGRYWQLLLCLSAIPFCYMFAIGKKMPFGATRHSFYLMPFLSALIACQTHDFLSGFQAARSRIRRRRLGFGAGVTKESASSEPERSASRWGLFAVLGFCFVYVYLALVMNADNEPYRERRDPIHRQGIPFYRARFTKIVEAPTLNADLERAWKVLAREARPNDLVLLTCPGMLITRFYLDPGVSMPFDPELPIHFSRDGVNFYYSPEVQLSFTANNIMVAVDDICTRYGIDSVGKVWIAEVGWEIWGPVLMMDHMKNRYPELLVESAAYENSGGVIFPIDGARARALGKQVLRGPLKPWPGVR